MKNALAWLPRSPCFANLKEFYNSYFNADVTIVKKNII